MLRCTVQYDKMPPTACGKVYFGYMKAKQIKALLGYARGYWWALGCALVLMAAVLPLVELYKGELVPSRAFSEGGIHEAILAYEDTVFFEILAQELALRDMESDTPTPENYDELQSRMDAYLDEFELHGTDNISVDME